MLKGPKLNMVVVCDEADRLAGIITKTDIIDRISGCLGHSCTMSAAQVMTREVITCYPDDWVNEVWSAIKQHSLKNIPIIDRGSRPVGVLSARDAVQFCLEEVEYEEKILRDYVMSVGYR